MDARHDAVPGPIGHANGHPIAQPHGPAGDRLYVVVWAVLLVLTGVTVGVSMLDMKKFAVLAAMVIAGTKAALVLLYFMHVRWEPRVIPVMIGVALAGLAVFFGLTFADLVFRYQ